MHRLDNPFQLSGLSEAVKPNAREEVKMISNRIKVASLLAMLALAVLVSSCSAPPAGLVSAAIDKAKKRCESHREDMNCRVDSECGGFEVSGARRMEGLSAADEASGITERWCIEIDCFYRCGTGYYDVCLLTWIFVKQNGKWVYETFGCSPK
jgi:hypothetical protein